MNRSSLFHSVRRLALPLALTVLTGCSFIEAQKLAGEGARLVEKGSYDEAVKVLNDSLAKANTPTAHGGLADAYLHIGQFALASAEAKKAIAMFPPLEGVQPQAAPELARYYILLGRAQLLQNDGPSAFEAANNVRHLVEPWVANNPQNKNLLKEALLLQTRIIQATDDPTKSLQILEDQGVQLRFPNDLDIKAEKAIVKALSHSEAEALAMADEVLKARPDEGDALTAKGIVASLKGDLPSAKSLLSPVLKEDRTRAMVCLRAVKLLRKESKNQEAVDLLKMLVEVQPNNHLIYMDMADAFFSLQRWDESIAAYLKVLETYPAIAPYHAAASADAMAQMLKAKPLADTDRSNMDIFYQNLALLSRNKQDFGNGIKYLERSAAINPVETTYRDMAIYYKDNKDMAGAIRVYEKLLAMNPTDAKIMKTLGQLTIETDAKKSREYFAQARKLAPNDSDILLGLGVGLFNAKLYKDAVTEFEALVELNPDNVDARYYLGLSQLQAGDKKSAEANLTKVTEMKADYAEAYQELGNIARDKKDYKAMEKFYNLADKYKGSKKK